MSFLPPARADSLVASVTSASRLTDSRMSSLGARAIRAAFAVYRARVDGILELAAERFEKRQWHEIQTDSVAILTSYRSVVADVVADIRDLLAERVGEKHLWIGIKAVYSSLVEGLDDAEIAETFFNSVTRQIFTTVGVDPQIEFVDTDLELSAGESGSAHFHSFPVEGPLADAIEAILAARTFHVPWEDRERDIALVATRVAAHEAMREAPVTIERIDILDPIFHRGRAAYLVGRLVRAADGGASYAPFVLALDNTERGIVVDAVLLDEGSVSILFSFAHSYFRVLTRRPRELVAFIRSIIPRKPTADLYISLGFNKHGKTELFRGLLAHIAGTEERFEHAAGTPGMVMVVFTMPGWDRVLKVIRDRFDRPKDVTRRQVLARYRLVFMHDRAGRLVDAQEFEHLEIPRARFSERLLEELLDEASNAVSLDGDNVVIRHAYMERRLVPLDVYLRQASPEAAHAAVIDYGRAVKDLMVTNVFPGDLLTKNFGVTRHGRVVFYDYDELCLLTDCNFRALPPARHWEDEIAAEPWFSVGERDIFPEEFGAFLGLPEPLRRVFMRHHGDILDAALWQSTQSRLRAGDLIRIYPYDREARLRA